MTSVQWTALGGIVRSMAAAGPVPVFPVVGLDARERVEDLGLHPDIDLASSPRHASVLLVAGDLRSGDREALCRVHDQLPHPRATLWWGAELPRTTAEFMEDAVTTPGDRDPRPAVRDLYRRLLSGQHPSERPLLPDEPPALWRGRGDFGQGGEGMMGGTPYGRPMPMPPEADLRDGLSLDTYTATVGPFLPRWPPGLTMEITWQGDVVQRASVTQRLFPPPAEVVEPFRRALGLPGSSGPAVTGEPPSIAELERARAGHHLRCIARLLEILELPALAERCRRTAWRAVHGESVDIDALRGWLGRAGVFAAVPPGLGRLPDPIAADIGGVPLRATGQAIDARAHQRVYDALGFRTVTQSGGDVRARLQQWLAEAEQAVRLAARAPDEPAHCAHGVESPWGRLAASGRHEPARLAYSFPELLIGLEWTEAMLVIASFDVASLDRMTTNRMTAGPVSPRDNGGSDDGGSAAA